MSPITVPEVIFKFSVVSTTGGITTTLLVSSWFFFAVASVFGALSFRCVCVRYFKDRPVFS